MVRIGYFIDFISACRSNLKNVLRCILGSLKNIYKEIKLATVFIFLNEVIAIFQVEIITKTKLEFPAVTVCNTNKIRHSAILESRHQQALYLDDLQPLPYYGLLTSFITLT